MEEQRVDVDLDAVQLEKGDQATPFQPRTELEFAVEPSQPAGIFIGGEPNALTLRLCNQTATPAAVAVDFLATDYAGEPASLPSVSVDVPPKVSMKRDLPLPADWQGYYRIRATAKVGAKTETGEVRIAIVPPPIAGDSVCGINHAFVTAGQIRLARKAGVTWFRDWSLKWQHIEPSKGEFRWERGDVQIDRVLREGLRVLPLLPPFPSAGWNSDAPASLAAGGSYPANRLRASFAPQEPNELAEFVGKAVRRYKDRIHCWEFLNEPIYTSYALASDEQGQLGGKRYTPADYVALLEVAAQGMREADPTCKVMGGIAGSPKTLTREVIEAGCLKHVDIFNLHIYPGKRCRNPTQAEMDELLAMMDAHGGRRPIWMTEFSYYGADNLPRQPFFPRANDWAEERLLDSERQCADYTVRFFLVMLSHGVEKVFIHSGASGQVNDPNYECALFDYGSVPRKLFAALAVLTNLLGERPVSVGESQVGELGHAAAFETGEQSVVALWSESEAPGPRVVIPARESVIVVDVVGRKMAGDVSRPVRLAGLSPRPTRQGAGTAHGRSRRLIEQAAQCAGRRSHEDGSDFRFIRMQEYGNVLERSGMGEFELQLVPPGRVSKQQVVGEVGAGIGHPLLADEFGPRRVAVKDLFERGAAGHGVADDAERDHGVVAIACAEGREAEIEEDRRNAHRAHDGRRVAHGADAHSLGDSPEDEHGVACVLEDVAEADHTENRQESESHQNAAGHQGHHHRDQRGQDDQRGDERP